LYLLILSAVIMQSCITLLYVYIEKHLEDFTFCKDTEYYSLISINVLLCCFVVGILILCNNMDVEFLYVIIRLISFALSFILFNFNSKRLKLFCIFELSLILYFIGSFISLIFSYFLLPIIDLYNEYKDTAIYWLNQSRNTFWKRCIRVPTCTSYGMYYIGMPRVDTCDYFDCKVFTYCAFLQSNVVRWFGSVKYQFEII
jgi:hypothetical protein